MGKNSSCYVKLSLMPKICMILSELLLKCLFIQLGFVNNPNCGPELNHYKTMKKDSVKEIFQPNFTKVINNLCHC